LYNYYNYSPTLCILNAEFQNFIPRFSKISLLCGYPLKEGDRGAKVEEIGGETEGDFTDKL
jgi:hypothetical protein